MNVDLSAFENLPSHMHNIHISSPFSLSLLTHDILAILSDQLRIEEGD